MRDAVKLKKDSHPTFWPVEAGEWYRQAKWSAAMAIAEAKSQAIFWAFMRCLRRSKQCPVNNVYSGDSVLLT